ncbi:MAG: hypothetical protein A2201_08715 [Alicyclobacillus sp. RIFOXYA1_FULL_53_8]|nr:MAG: hypothetical protein A2201_08715 [Alicyclobacillus sp. RIFOXYA1_FULL_53_8]
MRICIVSDTHRHRTEMMAAVETVQPVDVILHAGDETSDVVWLRSRVDSPITAVSGNWDTYSEDFPQQLVLDQYGPRILLVHGHTLRVKDGVERLLQKSNSVGASIVVYGHTHVAYAAVHKGILVLNPGSLAEPRGRREPTFALLEVDDTVSSSHYEVRLSHITSHGVVVEQMNTQLIR